MGEYDRKLFFKLMKENKIKKMLKIYEECNIWANSSLKDFGNEYHLFRICLEMYNLKNAYYIYEKGIDLTIAEKYINKNNINFFLLYLRNKEKELLSQDIKVDYKSEKRRI